MNALYLLNSIILGTIDKITKNTFKAGGIIYIDNNCPIISSSRSIDKYTVTPIQINEHKGVIILKKNIE
jgi:hypothetical protein